MKASINALALTALLAPSMIGRADCLDAFYLPANPDEGKANKGKIVKVAKQEAVKGKPLSKVLKAAFQDLHDEAANTELAKSILSKKITQPQYNLYLLQRLAIIETLERSLYKNDKLPQKIKGFLGENEHNIAVALRKDLSLKPGDALDQEKLLPGTLKIIEAIKKMQPEQQVIAVYILCGETAFGARDLVEALNESGISNTGGLSSFSTIGFGLVVMKLNAIELDEASKEKLIEAGREFYKLQTAANNAKDFKAGQKPSAEKA